MSFSRFNKSWEKVNNSSEIIYKNTKKKTEVVLIMTYCFYELNIIQNYTNIEFIWHHIWICTYLYLWCIIYYTHLDVKCLLLLWRCAPVLSDVSLWNIYTSFISQFDKVTHPILQLYTFVLRAPFRYKMACGVQFLRWKVMKKMLIIFLNIMIKVSFNMQWMCSGFTHLWSAPAVRNQRHNKHHDHQSHRL